LAKGLGIYGFAAKSIAIFIFVMLVSMLLSGCASQEQQNTGGELIKENKTGTVVTENKTGYEKTNESIALAVADGTYIENVTYPYHVGLPTEANETIEVKVTVEGDVITDVSITAMGTPHQYSAKLILGLNAALPDLVVGKKITELNIPKNVAGSSLTTAAFKGYLENLVETY
jgi:uncharacterized protein YceK